MLKIECPPLTIRDWQMHDLDRYRRWLQPGQRWQELDGPHHHALAAEHVDAKVEDLRRRVAAQTWPSPRTLAPIADAASDTLVGVVSWYWLSQDLLLPAVGIALFDPTVWGHGLGTVALGHWCAYLFRSLPQIVCLDIQTRSDNPAMMRVATKLGFQEEGRFRNGRIVRGQSYDVIGYGIVRQEWEDRYPAGFQS